MKKSISDITIFLLLFFLSMLFLRPVFSATLICSADNDRTYRMDIPKEAYGQLTEVTNWVKGRKAGIKQELVVKNVHKPDFSDDYIQFTDGKYKVTYSLRCAYE